MSNEPDLVDKLLANLKKNDTPERRAEDRRWHNEEKLRKRRQKSFVASIVKQVKEFYGKDGEGSHMDFPKLAASVLECQDFGDFADGSKVVDQLYVKWAIEHHVGRKVANNMADIDFCYNGLHALGAWERSEQLVWNDCDNYAEIIPHRTKKIFTIRTQNRNYLFIVSREYGPGSEQLHIRRFWDDVDLTDKWEREELTGLSPEGVICAADHATERYSDRFEGRPNNDCWAHIRRPNLEYFRQKDFDPTFKDFRDSGYVATYPGLRCMIQYDPDAATVEGGLYYHAEIGSAIFDLHCLVDELQEALKDQNSQQSASRKEEDTDTKGADDE